MDIGNDVLRLTGYGCIAMAAWATIAYSLNPEVRKKMSVIQLLLTLIFFGGTGVWMVWTTPDNGPAYEFVIRAAQDRQGLYKDQYELSAPFDNSRGTIVVAKITDKNILSDNGYKYLAFLLTKQQGGDGEYSGEYTYVFLVDAPDDDKVDALAKQAGFMD